MGRIRTVKPEFFMHEGLFEAERSSGLPVRLAFAGLWTQADKAGRFKWRPRTLKAAVLPHDEIDFVAVLAALETGGFVRRYSVGAETYGWIPSFATHQRPNHREAESDIPPCPDAVTTACPPRDDAVTTAPSVPHGGNGTEGKGKERNGGVAARCVGQSAEWDRAEAAMERMRLDEPAKARLRTSAADTLSLHRLVLDAESDRRVIKKAAYLMAAVAKMEGS